MELTTVDHVEKGLGRIISKLQKENFETYCEIFLQEAQELEDVFNTLAEQKNIDIAEGVWLDYIGKIVGEARNGRTDEEYRTSLKLQIGINRSDGTPDVIIDLVRQYTGSTDVRLAEGRYAFGTISVNGQDNIGSGLWDLVDQIKPAATKWLIGSDYTNTAFRPAWRLRSTSSEAFETTDDGLAYEDFETTDDGTTYEQFYTVSQTASYLGDTSRATLSWRVQTTDTFNAEAGEVFMEAGEPDAEAGNILGFENSFDKIVPLHWKIYPDSTDL